MEIRFWQAPLKEHKPAKYLLTALIMLALIVGTFTTNLLFVQPAAAATLAQQHTTGGTHVQSAARFKPATLAVVPNVLSLSLGEAEAEITLNGTLVVGRVAMQPGCHDDLEGTVIEQDPLGGNFVPVGTAVNLTELVPPRGGCN